MRRGFTWTCARQKRRDAKHGGLVRFVHSSLVRVHPGAHLGRVLSESTAAVWCVLFSGTVGLNYKCNNKKSSYVLAVSRLPSLDDTSSIASRGLEKPPPLPKARSSSTCPLGSEFGARIRDIGEIHSRQITNCYTRHQVCRENSRR